MDISITHFADIRKQNLPIVNYCMPSMMSMLLWHTFVREWKKKGVI
ncbi:MAG: hypothetical protein J6R06_08275 [Bacteroidales bacterium]|nr:hypothetical protein [Bacteroidales bacterium]